MSHSDIQFIHNTLTHLLDITNKLGKVYKMDAGGQKYMEEVHTKLTMLLNRIDKNEKGGEGQIMSFPSETELFERIEIFSHAIAEAGKLPDNAGKIMIEVFSKSLIKLQWDAIILLQNQQQ